MILIPCPHCGPRNASEYHYVGEQRTRPDPATSDPAEWRSYLYTRTNAAGWVTETWLHRAGCRRYLTVQRDTVTNEVRT
jgi:heterotetrameric sarcosine oxidase delta subunit